MPTLKTLQTRSNNQTDAAKALEAALELIRFYSVYNIEYHLIEDKIEEADLALFDVDNNDTGIDQAKRGALSDFLLEQRGRLALLNAKLRAFEASELNIAPPTKEMVAQVKKESAKVAVLQAKDDALAAVINGLTDIAHISDKTGLPD